MSFALNHTPQTPTYNCRFHPTEWFHEVGCPHREWTVEELKHAIDSNKLFQQNNLETNLMIYSDALKMVENRQKELLKKIQFALRIDTTDMTLLEGCELRMAQIDGVHDRIRDLEKRLEISERQANEQFQRATSLQKSLLDEMCKPHRKGDRRI
jgi:hypothetical protein